jgi:predicted amidophosphoribosyltransferase
VIATGTYLMLIDQHLRACASCGREAHGSILTCNVCLTCGVELYFHSGECWAKHQRERHGAPTTPSRERRRATWMGGASKDRS